MATNSMCEREYVGCPDCGAMVEDAIRRRVEQSETIEYAVDSNGDTNYDHEPSYGEPHEDSSEYACMNCAWTGPDLDHEAVEEDCDCAECDPESEIADPSDPDNIVLLVRTQHHARYMPPTDAPAEVIKLLEDRTLTFLPVRAARASEINDSLAEIPICIDLETPVSPQMLNDMIPEEEAA